MNKISTVEELQSELNALFALTKEATPSRTHLASALESLAARVAGDKIDTLISIQDFLKERDSSGLKKALDGLKGSIAAKYLIEAMLRTATRLADVSKLLAW